MDGDQPISYYKEDIKSFTDPDAKMKWVSLRADPCVGKIKDVNKAGMLSLKLSIHDETVGGQIDFRRYDSWRAPAPPRASPIKIRAYIYQCRNLPAADSDGTSDPYIKLWHMDEEKLQTKVVNDSTNPLFFEVLDLKYEVRDKNDLSTYPPLIFDVYDQDTELFDSTDDFLGRAVINADDCSLIMAGEQEMPDKPRWHPIRFAIGEPECGEILVSFSVSSLDH